MNSKNLRLAFLLTFLGLSVVTFAQDAAPAEEEKAEPTFTLSGSIDAYAHTSLGWQNGAFDTYAPSTSFADLKGFSLGMANLVASYSGEKSGFVADLVFGPRGKAAVFGDGALYGGTGQNIVNQLYAYYKLSDAVTLNLGQFNTFLGYEVISPAVNFHYSTSYLFSWGPFNHTGLRADFSFGEGMVAKLAVMNPTDVVEFNPVNTYTIGAQIGKTTDAGGIWLNVLYGDQDGKLKEDINGVGDDSFGTLFQWDITTGWNLSETFYLGANISQQSLGEGEVMTADGPEDDGADATSFFGVALYPKLTLSESFSLGLRAEYFAIKKGHLGIIGLDGDGDGSVTAFTLTGNYKVGGLTIIPELRMDKTSEDSFYKLKDNGTDADIKDQMITANLAFVYKF